MAGICGGKDRDSLFSYRSRTGSSAICQMYVKSLFFQFQVYAQVLGEVDVQEATTGSRVNDYPQLGFLSSHLQRDGESYMSGYSPG